ncbi:hypothetical protein AB0F72_27560 [Actinoplanes sp. NPDC023936]|uniref:hypothetical protein n=1 Tax=Actinoplanes sp. NPDC023936 TaxID=3154910 RepID=UPI0033F485D6
MNMLSSRWHAGRRLLREAASLLAALIAVGSWYLTHPRSGPEDDDIRAGPGHGRVRSGP